MIRCRCRMPSRKGTKESLLLEAQFGKALCQGQQDCAALHKMCTRKSGNRFEADCTMWGLGNLFQAQKELAQAKQMFQRALTGFQVVLGVSCAQIQQLGRALASLDAPKSKSRALIRRIKRRIFSS